jgi:hypothetical protein
VNPDKLIPLGVAILLFVAVIVFPVLALSFGD